MVPSFRDVNRSVLKGREPYGSVLLGRELNQLDCFCLEPLYPPPNAPPDERFQTVVLPCCTGVSHFACIARQICQTAARTAAGVRLGESCPYCRRRAFMEYAVATEQWAALVRQHNQHMPNPVEEQLRFMADIVNAPRTPSPPPAAHHHQQQQQVQAVQQQQQVQAVQQQRRRRTVRDDRRYEIAAIVCSRRAADGQRRELRIHWRSFGYRDDTFEAEADIARQAPQIHAAWLELHDLGHTPSHNYQFPERPQGWMSTVRSGRNLPVVESIYPGRNPAHRRLFDAQGAAAEAQNVPPAPAEEAMEEEEEHHQNLPGAPAAAANLSGLSRWARLFGLSRLSRLTGLFGLSE
ncbi:hypothetical protein niasHT_035271 [Heterodera trifolii]|uniref:Chromo domain-containing protein n=1 Tax=Heterodera trifolii TaxID=157864 RepID=A0ABD2J2B0_9BILA